MPTPDPFLKHHREAAALVNAPAPIVFAALDAHDRLASHMSEGSWRMGGGSMVTEFDAALGKGVGARIRLAGRVLGLTLVVDEVVTEYEPPARKVWRTTGTPRLLVIGHYRMGFAVEARGAVSLVRVFIDYAFPDRGIARVLGFLLGGYYARWCVEQMVAVATRRFGAAAPG